MMFDKCFRVCIKRKKEYDDISKLSSTRSAMYQGRQGERNIVLVPDPDLQAAAVALPASPWLALGQALHADHAYWPSQREGAPDRPCGLAIRRANQRDLRSFRLDRERLVLQHPGLAGPTSRERVCPLCAG